MDKIGLGERLLAEALENIDLNFYHSELGSADPDVDVDIDVDVDVDGVDGNSNQGDRFLEEVVKGLDTQFYHSETGSADDKKRIGKDGEGVLFFINGFASKDEYVQWVRDISKNYIDGNGKEYKGFEFLDEDFFTRLDENFATILPEIDYAKFSLDESKYKVVIETFLGEGSHTYIYRNRYGDDILLGNMSEVNQNLSDYRLLIPFAGTRGSARSYDALYVIDLYLNDYNQLEGFHLEEGILNGKGEFTVERAIKVSSDCRTEVAIYGQCEPLGLARFVHRVLSVINERINPNDSYFSPEEAY